MVFSDILGHALNAIKQGQKLQKKFVITKRSKFVLLVLNKLVQEGLIYGFTPEGSYLVKIFLKYNATGKPLIFNIERISKSSRRCFIKAYQVATYLKATDNGLFFLTTSYGILTNHEALQKGVGGEILFKVNS